jgi:hypothetical protein
MNLDAVRDGGVLRFDRVPQVIGDSPFKVINRRDQLWFQPAALLISAAASPSPC